MPIHIIKGMQVAIIPPGQRFNTKFHSLDISIAMQQCQFDMW